MSAGQTKVLLAAPQPPQLLTSLRITTHVLPHRICLAVQFLVAWHLPLTHTAA